MQENKGRVLKRWSITTCIVQNTGAKRIGRLGRLPDLDYLAALLGGASCSIIIPARMLKHEMAVYSSTSGSEREVARGGYVVLCSTVSAERKSNCWSSFPNKKKKQAMIHGGDGGLGRGRGTHTSLRPDTDRQRTNTTNKRRLSAGYSPKQRAYTGDQLFDRTVERKSWNRIASVEQLIISEHSPIPASSKSSPSRGLTNFNTTTTPHTPPEPTTPPPAPPLKINAAPPPPPLPK